MSVDESGLCGGCRKFFGHPEGFKRCPFDGEFLVLNKRKHPTLKGAGYYIQCKNMGCILTEVGGYLVLDDLRKEWNKRI